MVVLALVSGDHNGGVLKRPLDPFLDCALLSGAPVVASAEVKCNRIVIGEIMRTSVSSNSDQFTIGLCAEDMFKFAMINAI